MVNVLGSLFSKMSFSFRNNHYSSAIFLPTYHFELTFTLKMISYVSLGKVAVHLADNTRTSGMLIIA